MAKGFEQGRSFVRHWHEAYDPLALIEFTVPGLDGPDGEPFVGFARPGTVERQARLSKWVADPGIGPERALVRIVLHYCLDADGDPMFERSYRDWEKETQYDIVADIANALIAATESPHKKKQRAMMPLLKGLTRSTGGPSTSSSGPSS